MLARHPQHDLQTQLVCTYKKHNTFFLHGTNKPTGSVPAPPPYSPPRSNRTSTVNDDAASLAYSPAARSPPNNQYRSSPEPNSHTFLPPPPPNQTPPNGRNRSASHDRPQALYNVSTVTRRTAPEVLRLSHDGTTEQQVLPRRPAPIITDTASLLANNDFPQSIDVRPPAGRRAISTGDISTGSSQSRASSRSRWEPGMVSARCFLINLSTHRLDFP